MKSQAVFESEPQSGVALMSILHATGEIIVISSLASAALGYNDLELENVEFLSLVHPDDQDLVTQVLENFFATGEST